MRCREELGTREYEGLWPCCSPRRVMSCGRERRKLYEALGQVRAHDTCRRAEDEEHIEALGPFLT